MGRIILVKDCYDIMQKRYNCYKLQKLIGDEFFELNLEDILKELTLNEEKVTELSKLLDNEEEFKDMKELLDKVFRKDPDNVGRILGIPVYEPLIWMEDYYDEE